MTISKELFLAILSVDAYNRSYNSGINLNKDKVGSATKFSESATQTDFESNASAQGGFYAVSYTVEGGVEGLASNSTVISYRGTDQGLPELIFDDYNIVNGRYIVDQLSFAGEFFRLVDDLRPVNAVTGHSLGGALAGFTAGVNQTYAYLVDPIGYGQSLNNLATDFLVIRNYLDFDDVVDARNQYFADGGSVYFSIPQTSFDISWNTMRALGLSASDDFDFSKVSEFINSRLNVDGAFLVFRV